MSGSVRTPRIRALADGAQVPQIISAQINSASHATADRFRLTIAASGSNAVTLLDGAGQLIDVQASLDGLAWISLVQGEIDHLRLDPISQRLIIEGRDLSARMIESRLAETFTNQTSSDVAQTLAGRHGLDANITATTTPIGAYWQLEHDAVSLETFCRSHSEWDLLLALAARERFDLWVSGTTLNFEPSAQAAVDPVTILVTDCLSAALERSLTLARDIEVTIKSWNSRQAKSFSTTARAARTGTASALPPLRYVQIVPNLTVADAQTLAQARLADLSRQERSFTAEMPGDLTLLPRQQIALAGTNTDFDQLYWIDHITRRIAWQSGFTQTIRARNASPGLDVEFS